MDLIVLALEAIVFSDGLVWTAVVVLVLAGLALATRVILRRQGHDWSAAPRSRRLTRVWATGIVGASLLLVLATVPNAFRHDDLDRLSHEQRVLVRTALGGSAGCYSFSHVTNLHLTDDDDPRHGFTFRCEATILGSPSFTGEAACAEGNWYLPGWREPNDSVPCR